MSVHLPWGGKIPEGSRDRAIDYEHSPGQKPQASGTGTPLLDVVELTAGYGDRVVVSSVNISLNPGTLAIVLGANGSGKTTILKTCMGLLPALSGQIFMDGHPVDRLPSRSRARLAAWVPQNAEAAWAYRVVDMVSMGRYASHGPFGAWTAHDEHAVSEALRTLDLTELAGRTLSSLSGGEARRVLMARALAQETRLLVLDEPAANLDPGRQVELLELLRARSRDGRAVIVSVHDVNLARRFADEVVLVAGNGTARFGPAHEILTTSALEDAFDTSFIHGTHESYGQYVLPLSRRRTSVPGDFHAGT